MFKNRSQKKTLIKKTPIFTGVLLCALAKHYFSEEVIALLAKKVAKTMLLNGGQVCIRGDYVLVPEAHFTPFVALVKDGAFLLRTWYLCIPTLLVKQVVHRVTLPLYGYTVHERK